MSLIRKPDIRTKPTRRDALTDPNAAARRTPKRDYRSKPKPAPLPATRVLRWAATLAGIAYAAGTIILTH